MIQLVVTAGMRLALLHQLLLTHTLQLLRRLPLPFQIAGQVIAQPALRGFREEVAPGIGRRLQRLQRPLGHPLGHPPEPVARLAGQVDFSVEGELPPDPAWVDAAQFEQALLNLLKNAHESGSKPEDVQLQVRRVQDQLRIDVLDRGSGMSEAVLTQALVPFYSTKRSGTGLGLALAREIAEAHGGRILLANRDGGGLAVTLFLPALSAPPSG